MHLFCEKQYSGSESFMTVQNCREDGIMLKSKRSTVADNLIARQLIRRSSESESPFSLHRDLSNLPTQSRENVS